MDVSENRGTPKSSILIGFSIIHHPFWGTTIFGNIHILWGVLNIAHVHRIRNKQLRPLPFFLAAEMKPHSTTIHCWHSIYVYSFREENHGGFLTKKNKFLPWKLLDWAVVGNLGWRQRKWQLGVWWTKTKMGVEIATWSFRHGIPRLFHHTFRTHPEQPLPTGCKGNPFIVGQGDCLGCAPGVCCNFLGGIAVDLCELF